MDHRKGFEILGDSLTFAGSLLLAAEALWKKTERIAIARKTTIVNFFPTLQDAQGKPDTPEAVERRWFTLWTVFAKFGACILTAGFAVLLAIRILVE